MRLTQLQYFMAVYEHQNITKAAEKLHISQPSITIALKELENEYHVNLFHRINKKMYLTEEGLLGVDDLTFTVTFRAGNRRCTRLCACSVTFRTLILQCELDLFLAAKNRLFKCDPYAGS